MAIETLFFELIQVAIGRRQPLSVLPTKEEWRQLYEIANRQALTAIAFSGVKKVLSGLSNNDDNAGAIDEVLYLQWLGLTAQLAQRNKNVNAACVKLVGEYAHSGIKCSILKGQGNLEYYPEDLQECRAPGDIDVWCSTFDDDGIEIAMSDLDGSGAHYEKYQGKRAVIEYVRMLHRVAGTKPRGGVRYHHIGAIPVNGVDVEAHFRPLFLDSPSRNRLLQKWFRINEQFGLHDAKIGNCVFPTPTVSFNAVYQLTHIYRHLFDEGIGLRQLLDYYFVLRALHIEQGELSDRTPSMAQWAEGMGTAVKSNQEIMHVLTRFGMKKFAGAVMYVLQTVFAMPDVFLICKPDEKEGKFLLDEIMQAGKFDKRIKRGGGQLHHAIEKTKHNLRLLAHYPEEVLCEPLFRLYHWLWRRLELWRW